MAWMVVNGTVDKVFYEGKALTVKESYTKKDGTAGASYFSAFFDEEHGLVAGVAGKFSGVFSVKPEIYNSKATANVTINSTRFEPVVDSGGFD